jgi:hypothetical protein
MEYAIEPKHLDFDGYTLCSFVPRLDTKRAVPLVVIGYREGEDPSFVWLVPKEGVSPLGLTNDPYYAKLLRDPRSYFTRKLNKYIDETGSVRRGIEMLIDCHQEHLAFTEFRPLSGRPETHPVKVDLVEV